jgi:hypothetical protein
MKSAKQAHKEQGELYCIQQIKFMVWVNHNYFILRNIQQPGAILAMMFIRLDHSQQKIVYSKWSSLFHSYTI